MSKNKDDHILEIDSVVEVKQPKQKPKEEKKEAKKETKEEIVANTQFAPSPSSARKLATEGEVKELLPKYKLEFKQERKSNEKTICLNMIIGNEEKIIKRCLDSLKNWIDYFVLCCNGKDKSIEVIKDYFTEHKISGELYETKWLNFGHNRTEAIKLAKNKSDYILLIDADMELKVNDPQFKQKLKTDKYKLTQTDASLRYPNIRLVNGRKDFYYKGVTHEGIENMEPLSEESSNLIEFIDHSDGGSKDDKYTRDIKLLEQGLIDEPKNSRYKFYLARSYQCHADSIRGKNPTEANKFYQRAVDMYQERILDKGWFTDEIWFSKYMIGHCLANLKPWEEALKAYVEAYNFQTTRVEPLYHIIDHYNKKQEYTESLKFVDKALLVKLPAGDALFVYKEYYNWGVEDLCSTCLYFNGQYQRAYDLCDQILKRGLVPSHEIERIKNNMGFSKKQLDQEKQKIDLNQLERQSLIKPEEKSDNTEKCLIQISLLAADLEKIVPFLNPIKTVIPNLKIDVFQMIS